MPLINLQTNLKSLKYGNDRQGGGDSGLPYIQTDISTANPGIKFDDGFVRGGAVNAARLGLIDTKRIFKFFKDVPQGPLFIARQAGLQLSNPRLEIPKNPSNIITGAPANLLAVSTNGLLEPTRIYNLGLNTIAQIPVNAFGGHFVRHGILPIQNEASKYEAVSTANNAFILNNSNVINSGYKSVGNRLLRLATKFDLGKQETSNVNTVLNRARGFINRLATTVGINIRGLKPDDLVIDEYKGGPGSIYGIVGSTTINRTLQVTNDKSKIEGSLSFSNQLAGKTRDNSGAPNSVNYFNDLGTGKNAIVNYDFGNGGIPFGDTSLVAGVDQNVVKYSLPSVGNPSIKTYAALKKQIDQQQKLQNPNKLTLDISNTGEIIDFYANQFGIYNTDAGTYSTTNVGSIGYKNSYGDTVVISGSVGSSWNKIAREQRVGSGRQDMINLTPIFEETKYYADNKITIGGKEHNINDLVRFRIQAVDTDSPDKGKWMVFRAYVSGLSDDTNAEWNDIKYTGRGEKFYVYNGFSRKINVTFKIAALSVSEMKYIYSKLNFLMSNTMPDYKGVLMRGPLVRMSIGSWLDSQLGKLDSVSLKVPDDSPWEISLNDNLLILPHIVEVSLSFTPIGAESRANNLIPRKSTYTSFIAQNNTGRDVTTLQYVDEVPAVNDETTVSTQQPSVGQANAQTPTSNNVNTNTNNQRAQQTQASRTQQTNANNILIPGRQSQQNPPIFPYNVSQQQVRQPAAPTPQYTLFFNTRR